MPNEPPEDHYEPAPIAEPEEVDEATRLQRINEAEDIESRREILLGQITVARGKLYEARAAGDEALAASLKQTIDRLTTERDGL